MGATESVFGVREDVGKTRAETNNMNIFTGSFDALEYRWLASG